ncbi:MAG: ATPase [Sphingomonas sp.]|nr:ATPase [Sphingomonas sp.]
MKRFYKEVTVADRAILLDGKPVRTPARAELILPTAALADAVAAEWRSQEGDIDPRTMRLTGLSNAAIDRVAPDLAAFTRPLAAYAESDLLCYRADAPPELIARQAEAWDPLLDWAGRRFDVRFTVTSGIVHAPQPAATIARLGQALAAYDAFHLAALAPIVTIGGSLVVALALAEDEVDPDSAFDLTHLDELWQARRWGEDRLALEARAVRKRDFMAAAQLLDLL